MANNLQQQQQHPPPPNVVVNYGAFDKDRSVFDAVRDATGEAKILTEAYYDYIPDFVIVSTRSQDDDDDDEGESNKENHGQEEDHTVRATFVGPWMHYVLVELFKNATTATMERHGNEASLNHWNEDTDRDGSSALPSIQIRIIQNADWTTIFIQDEGVGLHPTPNNDDGVDGNSTSEFTTSHPFTLSSFRFGNTDKLWDRLDEQTTYAMVRSPLRGMGVGLALSACMMQHFGGTLRLESPTLTDKDGNAFGTRAVLQLPRDLTILEKKFDDDDLEEAM
eukprot:scaffold7995_cov173-Amphora_coffeaeformis.AAC.2